MARPNGIISPRINWTDEESTYLLSIYQGKYRSEIARLMTEKFNRTFTINTIKSRMKTLNIRSGVDCCFKKGLKPWNDGIKGYMGANETSFKKGSAPPNKKPIGSETLRSDGYIWIKVFDNKWMLKQRYVYEQHYGKLRNEDNIIFLDGDKLNCDINNLAIVSNSELFILNRDNLIYEDPELTKVGLNIAKVISKVSKLK